MMTTKQLAHALATNPAQDGDLGPEMPDGDHGNIQLTASHINDLAWLLRQYDRTINHLIILCELAYYSGWDDHAQGIALNKREGWDDGPTRQTVDSIRFTT